VTQERGFEDLSVSPDGRRIAATVVENAGTDLWIYHRERDALTRLTQAGDCGDPLWSPDGNRIIYTNPASLYVMAADGKQSAGEAQFRNNGPKRTRSRPTAANCCTALSPPPQTMRRCGLLAAQAGAPPTQMFPGVARVVDARFSPDGHWIGLRFRAVGPGRRSICRRSRVRASECKCPRKEAASRFGRRTGRTVFPHAHQVYGRGCESAAGARRRQTAAIV